MHSLTKKIFTLFFIILSSINLGFANPGKYYILAGGETGVLSMHRFNSNWKEKYDTLNLTGGIDYGQYFYESGFSYAFPITGGMAISRGPQTIYLDYEHKFYNSYVDANRRFAVTDRMNIITGVGLGLLNEKTSIKAPRYLNYGLTGSYKSQSQALQGRAKIGAQYQFTEKFNTTINLQGQGSIIDAPRMLGVNLVFKYDF